MNIVAYGSEPHYLDHLKPVAAGLEARGLEVPTGMTRDVYVAAEQADLVLVASRKDSRRFERVVMVEHGSGQRYGNNAGGPDTPEPQVVLFLAPSDRVAEQDAVVYPNAVRLGVGSPRVEYLSNLHREPSKVVIAFHWQAGNAMESRSAWDWHQRALPSLVKRHDMIGHGHPRMIRRMYAGYKKWSIPIEQDWTACVKQASVLICDNSSIMWEACALDIPIVILDAPWYKKDWGLRFWEFADAGPRTMEPGKVADMVDLIFEDDQWKTRRAEAAEYVYGQVEGSTDRAVEAVLNL